MNAKLKRIDARGEILANLFRNGRITEAKYLAELRKLCDRAEALLAA